MRPRNTENSFHSEMKRVHSGVFLVVCYLLRQKECKCTPLKDKKQMKFKNNQSIAEQRQLIIIKEYYF